MARGDPITERRSLPESYQSGCKGEGDKRRGKLGEIRGEERRGERRGEEGRRGQEETGKVKRRGGRGEGKIQ